MIKSFINSEPLISADAFISETSVIIGNVSIGSMSSVWYNVVIRGDVNKIRIGKCTNIQDSSLLHVTGGMGEFNTGHPLIIGDNVTVAHCVTLHGCTLQDNVFIGMNAIIMDGVIVGRGAMVAAGSLVTERTVIPPDTLWMGSPARFKRMLTEAEKIRSSDLADSYVKLSRVYIKELNFSIQCGSVYIQ